MTFDEMQTLLDAAISTVKLSAGDIVVHRQTGDVLTVLCNQVGQDVATFAGGLLPASELRAIKFATPEENREMLRFTAQGEWGFAELAARQLAQALVDVTYHFQADEWHASFRSNEGSGADKWWALRSLQDCLAGGELGIAFELGAERYGESCGLYPPELRNPQLYPRQFLEGWDHAQERHWERVNLDRVEAYYEQ